MSDCDQWAGYVNRDGYGVVREGADRDRRAHRVAYELAHGPIPPGLVVDHICHNEALLRGECDGGSECPHRRCVNPAHLEVKSDRDNIAAGALGYASRTLCRAGLHDITEPGSWVERKHGRQCRECDRERHRESKARRRANIARIACPVCGREMHPESVRRHVAKMHRSVPTDGEGATDAKP